MKKEKSVMVFVLVALLVACSPKQVQSVPEVKVVTQTSIASTSVPAVIEVASIAPTEIPTPTEVPLPTPVPTNVVPEKVMKIRAIMEEYGKVDEKYLTESYWAQLDSMVEKYGPAQRIVPFEFHGDNYNFEGACNMTPEKFEELMRYLLDNEVHFVTGPELVGFLEGWLELPARSIILTSDSGRSSKGSFSRIIPLFQKLEAEYGVSPHMMSFIWTNGMTEEETIACKDDACWQMFREVRDSGFFTIGSHTETHRSFGDLGLKDSAWDLREASGKIFLNLGLRVYGITWPFEVCSPFDPMLENLGYKFAFGGWTRQTNMLYVYANDNMPLCLPRLFAPNTDGYSSRPTGMTIDDLISTAMQDVPLK